MQYTINIDPVLVPFIEAQAALDNVTVEVWLERKLKGNISSVWRQLITDKVRIKPIEDVAQFDTVIKAKEVEIEAAKPVKADEALDPKTP